MFVLLLSLISRLINRSGLRISHSRVYSSGSKFLSVILSFIIQFLYIINFVPRKRFLTLQWETENRDIHYVFVLFRLEFWKRLEFHCLLFPQKMFQFCRLWYLHFLLLVIFLVGHLVFSFLRRSVGIRELKYRYRVIHLDTVWIHELNYRYRVIHLDTVWIHELNYRYKVTHLDTVWIHTLNYRYKVIHLNTVGIHELNYRYRVIHLDTV